MTARKPIISASPAQPSARNCGGPRVDEHGLDVEDDEEDGRQVELDARLDVPAARALQPHSKGEHLLARRVLLAEEARDRARAGSRTTTERDEDGHRRPARSVRTCNGGPPSCSWRRSQARLPCGQRGAQRRFDRLKRADHRALWHPRLQLALTAGHASPAPRSAGARRRRARASGDELGRSTTVGGRRRSGPTASPGRPSKSRASPRRRKMSAAASPSCAYWMREANDLLALLLLAELDAGGAEEPEPLGDERARVGGEHLPLRRAQEDGERRGPRPEELDDAWSGPRVGGRPRPRRP